MRGYCRSRPVVGMNLDGALSANLLKASASLGVVAIGINALRRRALAEIQAYGSGALEASSTLWFGAQYPVCCR